MDFENILLGGGAVGEVLTSNLDRFINDYQRIMKLVGISLFLTTRGTAAVATMGIVRLQLSTESVYDEEAALLTVQNQLGSTAVAVVPSTNHAEIGNFKDKIFELEAFSGIVGGTTTEEEKGALYLNLFHRIDFVGGQNIIADGICTLWFQT